MSILRKTNALVPAVLFAIASAGAALAQSEPSAPSPPSETIQQHHHGAEVNRRLANQQKRINAKVAHGQLTRAQAAQLHGQDRQVRQEEKNMASQNGGHINNPEQRTLNQQENAVSRQIGK